MSSFPADSTAEPTNACPSSLKSEPHTGVSDDGACGCHQPSYPVEGGIEAASLRVFVESSENPSGEEGEVASPTPRRIVIDTDEHRVIAEACEALGQADGIYQRAGQLVVVVEPQEAARSKMNVRKRSSPASIRLLSRARLREHLTRIAQFEQVKATDSGSVVVRKHPPQWTIDPILERGTWPVRQLDAIVTHPAFLADGSILSNSGYHPASHLYLSLPPKLKIIVPDCPNRDDVARAVATLEDVIIDFPFRTPAHKSAWVAGLLTPVAWFGFDGPAPFFLIDANVRGAGKGLSADVIAVILFGRRFSTMAYTNDREELRKKITSLAVAGERAVMLDNLVGNVGNDVFDNALTSTSWKDRILGSNATFDGPLHMTWFGTGNNVVLGADTTRRTCHIRMESLEERPELKANFRHKKLLQHVLQNRRKLLEAALTNLKGWHFAGRPTHDLARWGSYEEWSSVVREAIVFAGLPDPGLTREELEAGSDRDTANMHIILDWMKQLAGIQRGITAAAIIQRCQDNRIEHADVLGAFQELCGELTGHSLGGLFKKFQRRNFGGWWIDKAGEDRTKASRWAVRQVVAGEPSKG